MAVLQPDPKINAFLPRIPESPQKHNMSKHFHTIPVKSIIRETPDTVTLSFDVPPSLQQTFQYVCGQYLTIKAHIGGQDVRRAYSMCSSPHDTDIAVTVKRVDGGKMSNYLADQIRPGSTLEVMPPDGRFTPRLDADKQHTYYLIGAGSGITPLMSILRTVLEDEPRSKVHLLYGSRHDDGIIFKTKLDELSRRYAGQFTVDYLVSQPRVEKKGGLMGMFSRGKVNWTGETGRIDSRRLGKFMDDYPSATEAHYYICGPGQMIDSAEQYLKSKGIDKKHIHSERFLNAGQSNQTVATGGGETPSVHAGGAAAVIELDGRTIETTIPEGKTILDALLDQKHEPPYSCTSGACSTCMAKLKSGTVKMDACYALDDDEVEEGYILTCQARPTSATVDLTFEV